MKISSAYVHTVISTHTPSRKSSRNPHKLRDLPRSAAPQPPLLLRRLGALRLILTLVCGLLAEPAAAQTPPPPLQIRLYYLSSFIECVVLFMV